MERLTIASASAAIQTGGLTPIDLVEGCLKQIDRHEEEVRAWVLVDREGARAEAVRLTAELKGASRRGPLHGIPIGIKDIIDVRDWPTAAGSKLWAKRVAQKDAAVVGNLRQAGAVLLGKTVTTAYASFDPPATRNPWHHAKTPGGSSSGSAAAVACGMCLGALATQTGGSITRPAAYCGVCGIKPTFGRVSLDGVVPLAFSMDHVGAVAGCAGDLAILLGTIAGISEGSPPVTDYVSAVASDPPSLQASRFRGLFADHLEPATRNVFDTACRRLDEAGLKIIDCPLPAAFSEVIGRHQMVMAVEAAAFHEWRYRRHPEDYPPRISSLIEEGLGASAAEYARTKEHQKALKTSLLELFPDGIGVALTPATPGPASDTATTGLPTFNSPWSYVGFPTVNIPIGWSTEGLPLAIQLVGQPWREAELLQMAVWCEKALGFEYRQV